MHDDTPRHRDPEVLERLFEKHNGNKSAVARELGVDVCTARRWLDNHGISDERAQLPSVLEDTDPDAIDAESSTTEGSA